MTLTCFKGHLQGKGGGEGLSICTSCYSHPFSECFFFSWYKGKMSRTEAEAFLMRTEASGRFVYQDGTFVVRDCESDKNQFSLSVK